MTVREIQQALKARGFDPGQSDGVWGAKTAAAVRAFQSSQGLVADGVVGPITAKALQLTITTPKDSLDDVSLVWFQEARRLMGLKEVAGPKDNLDILDWAKHLDVNFPHDSIPWCGLFVGHCIGSTLATEPLPNNVLGARNWLRFGVSCTRQPGAILVFWRESPSSGLGHVGFYVGEDDDSYFLLGGNQSDSVSIVRIDPSRLLGARWPSSVPLGTAGPRKTTLAAAKSTKED